MTPAAAKRPQMMDAAHEDEAKRKKPRRGVRRSKAERLAKRQLEASAASPAAAVAEAAATIEQLQSASCSPEWEALLPTLTTADAACAFVQLLLWSKRLPKAAAHYAQRLPLLTPELVLRLAQECPQPREADDDNKPPSTALLAAQFLLDLPVELLPTHSRLDAFLWPWLTTESDKAGPASHLLLQLPPPAVSGERKALARRREQTLELQRALVQQCLAQGQLLHLVPQYVSAFQHQLQQRPALQTPAPPAPLDDGSYTSSVALHVAERMQTLLQMIWADARVLVFGSSATGLRQDGQEDLDLCVLLPSSPLTGQASAPLIEDMKEHLALYLGPQTNITAVTGARVPIVHFVDPESRLSCDLCVNNTAALWNTQLLRWLVHEASPAHSDAIVALAKWLKRWRRAKQRVFGGSLSSYGLLLLLLHFLQRKRVLPAVDVASLYAPVAAFKAVNCDAMYQQLAMLAAKQQSQSKEEGEAQPAPWTQWLMQFFQFYAMEFDFEHDVVSLRGRLTKQNKQWTRKAWTTALSIEDPIELQRDLGALFHRRSLAKLRCAIAHACVQLSDPATRSLDDLLQTFPYEQPPALEPEEEEADAGEE